MKASQDVPHRMRCCRMVCGRHLISLVNSNSEVSCHKCDPGGLEADIRVVVDNKVHLISMTLAVLPVLKITVLIPSTFQRQTGSVCEINWSFAAFSGK